MKTWKIVLRYGLVFVLGVLVGAFGIILAVKQGVQKWRAGDQPAIILNRLSRQLDLTPTQRTKIEPVVRNAWFEVLQAGLQQRQILQKATDEIRPLLDARQQERFDVILARLRENIQRLPTSNAPPPAPNP
jgi:hypothetical protein